MIAMAIITLYLFDGQFTSFVVTSDINSQLRSMQAVNAAMSNELAARIEKRQPPTAESLTGLKKRDRAWRRRQVAAWEGTKSLTLNGAQDASVSFPDFINKEDNPYTRAIHAGEPFKEIIRDKDELYLRVASVFPVGSDNLTVVTSEPLDSSLVAEIAANLGEITLYAAGITLNEGKNDEQRTSTSAPKTGSANGAGKKKDDIVLSEGKSGNDFETDPKVLRPTFSVGSLATPTGLVEPEITFCTPLQVVDWKTGDMARAGALGKVRTRPSVR